MIDELRARFPRLGFALYALEPGAPVTFEVHDNGDVYAFPAATAHDAIAAAFPDIATPDPEPPDEPPAPDTASVFD